MNTTANSSNPYAPPKAAVQDVADAAAPLERAGRGTRLIAVIVDTLIFFAVFWLPLFATGAFRIEGGRMQPGDFVSVGSLIALVAVIVWAVVTFRLVKANGQSIAKKMFGIKVVRSDGSPASVGRIFWLRNVVNAIPGMIPLIGGLYGLADALLIFGQPRQCIHDKIADTIVVKA